MAVDCRKRNPIMALALLAVGLGVSTSAAATAVSASNSATSRSAHLAATLAGIRRGKSPVQKVLAMLDDMGTSVDTHMQEEKEAFKKFDCYCSKTSQQLGTSIATRQEKIPQLQSSIEESTSIVSQLKNDLEEHKASKAAAEQAIKEQAQLRRTEKKKFESDSSEIKTNIKSLKEAIKVLKKVPSSNTMLQLSDLTATTDQVRSLLQKLSADALKSSDRDQLVSCLERLDRASTGSALASVEGSEEGEDLASATQDISEVVGMLDQMLDDMKKDLEEMTKAEADSKAQAEALTEAKKKEIATVQKTIEDKHKRLSDTEVEKVQLGNDLSSSQRGLASDSQLLGDLKVQCATKKAEYEELKEDLQEELTAIRQTAKMLSSDDASDILSKTSAGQRTSFLQVASQRNSHSDEDGEVAAAAADTLEALGASSPSSPSISLLAHEAAVAAQTVRRQPAGGGLGGLGKITKMVVQMGEVLKKEQEDDDLKKQMCGGELERETKRSKGLAEDIEAKAANIGSAEVERDATQKDIDALRKGISDLDVSVKESTARRKAGHEEFVKVLAELSSAIELLRAARDRLGDYYKKKASLLQQQQEEGEEEPTNGEGEQGDGKDDLSLLSSGSDGAEDQQSAQPNKQAARKKRGLGVLGFIEKIEAEVQKELKEEKKTEKNDQATYEKFIAEAGAKRETDTQTLSVRVATLAEVTEKHRVLTRKHKTLRGELDGTKKVIANLHKECDWLMKYYKERRTKRAAEAEALNKAKGILMSSGVKFAQVKSH